MDRGTVVKLLRCRDCKGMWREENPSELNIPSCPKCGGANTYYSEKWYISYTLKSGEQKLEAISSNKRIAKEALSKISVAIVDEQYFDKPQILSWQEATDLFKKEILSQMKPPTRKFYEYRIDKYLTPFFGEKNLQDITLQDGVDYKKKYLDNTKLTDDSKTKAIITLKKMFNDFYLGRIMDKKGRKYLLVNPLAGLTRYPKPAARTIYHTADEVRLLLDNAPSLYIKVVILLASDAGLRSNTVKNLRISHFNFDKNRLEIPPEIRKCGKETHYKVMTKRLREAALAWIEHLKTLKTSDLLFASPVNPEKPLAKFNEYWRETLKKVGINRKILLKNDILTKKKLTEQELEIILNNVTHKALKPFILLVLDAQLKINEAKQINKLQLDLNTGTLLGYTTAKMTERLKAAIVEYIGITENEEIADWVFPNRYNKDNGLGSFEQQWRKTLKAAGIKKRFHDLKHTAGTYMYKITKDIRKVADFLDQADINQARKYAHVDDEESRRDVDDFEKLML